MYYAISFASHTGYSKSGYYISTTTTNRLFPLLCLLPTPPTNLANDKVCATCGTAYEGNVNEVVEMENNMLIGINRRRIKRDKVSIPV